MKRLIPLWITAVGGFVLIVAYFIPITQDWGEIAAIWFDILAAIAFVLGGGNLLKIHLKKVSDRGGGWGYSLITVVAFLGMLAAGIFKLGSPPAPNQEFYGETFAQVPLESIPSGLAFTLPGDVPERPDGHPLHASVRSQIHAENGEVSFSGWMRGGQAAKLDEHSAELEWQCLVEQLAEASKPQGPLAGKVAYYADHESLAITGRMTDEQRDALKGLAGADAVWTGAVDDLYGRTSDQTSVSVGALPPYFDPQSPAPDVTYESSSQSLGVTGPLTKGQRAALNDLYVLARPVDGGGQDDFIRKMKDLGPIEGAQETAAKAVFAGGWTVPQLRTAVDLAGAPEEVTRTPCALRTDQKAGMDEIPLEETVGESQVLNNAQVAALNAFASDPTMTVDGLVEALEASGPLKGPQKTALTALLGSNPTVGERNKALCFAMLKARNAEGELCNLNQAQRDFLLADHRDQAAWELAISKLFHDSHTVKYPWSGEYRAQGNMFWWLYEYAFKPLQATIFAMLAFYVASAAFRAFRAKNIEAILLLGTAFIILLGRTFAGVVLTGWMPESLSGLRIENLTVTIMKVFNTAGNRAIMIGIALGIASTSLRVLLGVDRSYLGSGED